MIEYHAENLILVLPDGSELRKDDAGYYYHLGGFPSHTVSELEEIAAVYLFKNPEAKDSRVWLEDILSEEEIGR